MQPPEGPPVCTALILPPSGAPPPISSTIVPQRRAHRHFDQAGVVDLAGQRKDFGALALFRADAGEPVRALADKSAATLAKVSTLLISVGQPHKPLSAGNGGRGRGVPRLPSTEAISAVSSPQTNAPAPMRRSMLKLKGDSKMPAPSKPMLLGLLDGDLQPA